jgi:hypothetical protein
MLTAEERERRRLLLDKFERLIWRLNVETRFVRAMQAAAAGEPIDWRVWPSTDPQAVSDQAAAEYGFNPQTLSRDTYEQPPGLKASLDPANRSFYDHLDAKLRYEAGPHVFPGYTGLIGIPFSSYEALEAALRLVYEPPPKAILACAADVYERVSAAIAGSALAGFYDVVCNPLLADGQVIYVNTAELAELPDLKFESTPDPDAFSPRYRCMDCLQPIYLPGYCGLCKTIRHSLPQPPFNIASIITGI